MLLKKFLDLTLLLLLRMATCSFVIYKVFICLNLVQFLRRESPHEQKKKFWSRSEELFASVIYLRNVSLWYPVWNFNRSIHFDWVRSETKPNRLENLANRANQTFGYSELYSYWKLV